MRAAGIALVIATCAAGCKDKGEPDEGATPTAKPATAKVEAGGEARLERNPAAPATWILRLPAPKLSELPNRSMGPLIVDGRAVVSSSQIGTVAVEPATGKVVPVTGPVVFPGSAADRLRSLPEAAKRASAHGRVRGWAATEDAYFVIWDRAIARVPRDPAAAGDDKAWTHPLAERVALGVAGPVIAGDWIVWVRDEVLEARRRDGSDYRKALGQYASCRRCLASGKTGLHTSVRAIRRDARVKDGVVSMAPAAWVPATQSATFGEPMIRSAQVLDALFGEVGVDRFPLIMVVRADRSLRNDAVHMLRFRGLGKPTGAPITWKLPPPNGRRTEPVRMAKVGDGLLVFYDARHLARLSLASK